ncbi:hypothetical protein Tco_0066423, partial [Tanacetum coccineum]
DFNVEDAKGVCVAVAYMEQKEEDVAQFMAKKRKRGPCKLLGSEGGESLRCLDAKLTLEMGQNERKRFGNEQMMKGASFTQGTISSISIGGSISFEGFLSSILLSVDRASLVKVPVANVTLFSSAQLLRENIDSVRSNQRMRPTAPSVPLK